MVKETSTDNGSNNPRPTGLECVPYTPCKLENVKDGIGKNNGPKLGRKDLDIASTRDEPQAGSSSKKRSGERRERRDEECNGIGDKDFEYYVKVIRWLECDGHIETTFRQKFLTWYSLRANPQEVRVVKVFIDTFIEEPGISCRTTCRHLLRCYFEQEKFYGTSRILHEALALMYSRVCS
ncbi:VIN3-like protein 2 [Forsythia ovata]|uniref:VIN3-like protein 2 n=1 Tax=Forsythia ovata TaxID=205694 RepID=A0ABD1R3D6_9LAMI